MRMRKLLLWKALFLGTAVLGLAAPRAPRHRSTQRRHDALSLHRPQPSSPPAPCLSTASALWDAAGSPRGGGKSAAAPAPRRRGVDFVALAKYATGVSVQLSLIYGLLYTLDRFVVSNLPFKVPFAVHAIFFYFLNANTGVFSPLSDKAQPKKKVLPSWTPPGWVFGLMWPVFVFGIRAVTSATIVSEKEGVLATRPIMALMFHLSFGNLWNTVNRVEQRLGASVPVLWGLLFSNLYASRCFYSVKPLAGKLLLATSLWLAAAAALETHTWYLNPDPDTGKREPLYPAKDAKWKSKFRWE